MSQDWIEKALKETERYFEEASDEQIEKDLKKAGYGKYDNYIKFKKVYKIIKK